jgi:hypothetical protein
MARGDIMARDNSIIVLSGTVGRIIQESNAILIFMLQNMATLRIALLSTVPLAG